jgi:hypothetical protein
VLGGWLNSLQNNTGYLRLCARSLSQDQTAFALERGDQSQGGRDAGNKQQVTYVQQNGAPVLLQYHLECATGMASHMQARASGFSSAY